MAKDDDEKIDTTRRLTIFAGLLAPFAPKSVVGVEKKASGVEPVVEIEPVAEAVPELSSNALGAIRALQEAVQTAEELKNVKRIILPHTKAGMQIDELQTKLPKFYKEISALIPTFLNKWEIFQQRKKALSEIEHDMKRIDELNDLFDGHTTLDDMLQLMEHATPASKKLFEDFTTGIEKERNDLITKYRCDSPEGLNELALHFSVFQQKTEDTAAEFLSETVAKAIYAFLKKNITPTPDMPHGLYLIEIQHQIADLISHSFKIPIKTLAYLTIYSNPLNRDYDSFELQVPNFFASLNNKSQINAYYERNGLIPMYAIPAVDPHQRGWYGKISTDPKLNIKVPFIPGLSDAGRWAYFLAQTEKVGLEVPKSLRDEITKLYEEVPPQEKSKIEAVVKKFWSGIPGIPQTLGEFMELAIRYAASSAAAAMAATETPAADTPPEIVSASSSDAEPVALPAPPSITPLDISMGTAGESFADRIVPKGNGAELPDPAASWTQKQKEVPGKPRTSGN